MNRDGRNSDDKVRSRSREPSINSSDFTVNPLYYEMNASDSSLLNTTASSDECESQADDLSPQGAKFDAVEYLMKSISSSMNSLELDRSIVVQSQLSGLLNNKTQELVKKIDELQSFLKESHERVAKYEKAAIPNLLNDLNKSEKRLVKLTEKLKKTRPVEFQKSKNKILNRISNEDDDLYV